VVVSTTYIYSGADGDYINTTTFYQNGYRVWDYSGGINSANISDGSILAIDLNTTNSPIDNYVLSYDNGTGGFTWVVNSGGGGGNSTEEIRAAINNTEGVYNININSTTVKTDNLTISSGGLSADFPPLVFFDLPGLYEGYNGSVMRVDSSGERLFEIYNNKHGNHVIVGSDLTGGAPVHFVGTLFTDSWSYALKTLDSGLPDGINFVTYLSGGFYFNKTGSGTANVHIDDNLTVEDHLIVKNLLNCDTIDTDASGKLICGTDDNTIYTHLSNFTNDIGAFTDISNFTGTLTNAKWCSYDSANNEIDCNIDPVTDTNANTICSGTTTYLDGEGNCDDLSTVYSPITGSTSITTVGTITTGTWKAGVIEDAYISNSITCSNYLPLAGGTMTGNIKMPNGGYLYYGAGKLRIYDADCVFDNFDYIRPASNKTADLGTSAYWFDRGYIYDLHSGDLTFLNGMRIIECGQSLCFLNQTNSTIMELTPEGDLNIRGTINENYNFD